MSRKNSRNYLSPSTLVIAVLISIAAAGGLHAQERKGLMGLGGNEPIPNPPGDDVTATGPDGQNQNQPVDKGAAEVELELGGSDEAAVGGAFSLIVTVRNNLGNSASNVQVRISNALRAADGIVLDSRKAIRYLGAHPVDCPGKGKFLICSFGNIPSGESRSTEVRVGIAPTASPGKLTLSADLQMASKTVGESIVRPPDKTVDVVRNSRTKITADLRLNIERDGEVSLPGGRIGHVVKIRNASEHQEATNVILEIRQRIATRPPGKSVSSEPTFQARLGVPEKEKTKCKTETKPHTYRCEIGTIPPGDERSVSVEAVIGELEPGRWGRLQTRARVRSSENDPSQSNNFASQVTNIVSRLPEIAFFAGVRSDRGESGIRPVDALIHGQLFGIAARFMDVIVDPPGELRVLLSIQGGESIELPLRRGSTAGSDRIYRSAQLFRLLAPGTQRVSGDEAVRAVYAGDGATLNVKYQVQGAAAQAQAIARVSAPQMRAKSPAGKGSR